MVDRIKQYDDSDDALSDIEAVNMAFKVSRIVCRLAHAAGGEPGDYATLAKLTLRNISEVVTQHAQAFVDLATEIEGNE